jgi:DNA-directed RNA polymerase subunit K/omega
MARDHGYARYKLDGCRCYTCGYANAVYCERRARAIAYGTWQPFVDAEPVRQHILDLRSCDLGLRRIAEAAGVDRKRLQAILTGRPERGTGPQEKIRPEIAAAVLAVEPSFDLLGDTTVIEATGTRRRLQALVTLGWSQAKLAERLGWTPGNFTVLMREPQTFVRTARKVRALYDELWDQAPPEDSHRDKISTSRARNMAQARGWVPPQAWDDDTIDDPTACPDVGATTSRARAVAENAEELVVGQGYTTEHAAERLGVSVSYVQEALRAARRREAVSA